MKTSSVCKHYILLVILAIGIQCPLLAQNPEALFQQGLIKEEGEGSLQEAIDIYIKVASDESVERPLQANALLHMGLCYEKLGRTEAQKTYRYIVNNYPDQAETVKIAREKLALLSQTDTNRKEIPREFNIRKIWEGPEDLLGEISPDGRYLSYVDWETGNLAIYELANGKKRPLTDSGFWGEFSRYAEDSRWSPDGKQLVYSWWNEKKTYELRTIGLDGSGPKVLYSNEEVNYMVPCDWSPDGKHVLACMYFQENRIQTAGLINVADGSMRVLKTLEEWPGKMCFTRDGNHIIYDRHQEDNSSVRDIYLLPVEGGNEIPLVQHPSDDFFLGLTTDGKNILFASDRDGTTGLYVNHLEDGKPTGDPKLVQSGMRGDEVFGFTPEGSFYYGYSEESRDVYMAEVDPGSGSVITPLAKLKTRFQGNNRTPDYSPDGKNLAYVSVIEPAPSNINFNRGGGNVLIIRSLETQQERKILPGLHEMGYPHWSPDGKYLMVVEWNENNSMGLHQIDVKTGQVKTIVSPDEGEPLRLFGQHEWSPDMATLYYGRLTNNSRNAQIISRDLESGEDKMIYESKEILHMTHSHDGRWLAVISRPRSVATYTMRVIPVSGGEARELFRFEQGERIYIGFSGSSSWSADGSHILFRLRDDKVEDPNWELCRIPASGGEIEKLGIIMPGENASSLTMHPDGRHIAFSSTSAPLPPAVWVIENFLPSD